MDNCFDFSVPIFSMAVRDVLGISALASGCFLRDATGRLTFVHAGSTSSEAVERLSSHVGAKLGKYVDADRGIIISPEELGEPELRSKALTFNVLLPDEQTPRRIAIVDRRVVGQDWSHAPATGWMPGEAARFVFWSLKGGVGRSTALAVLATYLARRDHRVLAIDLDLESPGLGATLLSPKRLPPFGALDWFVETGVQGANALDLGDFLGEVPVSDASGLFHVIPAVGYMTVQNPANLVPKLGRAYLEDVEHSGRPETFLQRTRHLVDWAVAEGSYDTILIDARAGLNESTAAALMGLGADILMFGLNTPQTFDGYRFFLSSLAVFPPGTEDNDWRLRLKMVHAKASASGANRAAFRDKSFQIFQSTLYEDLNTAPDQPSFTFNVDDPDGPHSPLIVLDDEHFREFDPLAEPDQLTSDLTSATFGNLLDGIMQRVRP